MLKILESAQKRMEAAKAFAKENGMLDQLELQLAELSMGGGKAEDGSDRMCVVLSNDFAPHSFHINWYYKGSDGEYNIHSMCGGLIYQGPTSPAHGGAPSFTVSLNSEDHGWFVHT